MSGFRVEADHVVCHACGARIPNTTADKVEHLTTPARARHDTKRRAKYQARKDQP